MCNAAPPYNAVGLEPGLPYIPSSGSPAAEVLVPGRAKVNSAGAHGHSEGKL